MKRFLAVSVILLAVLAVAAPSFAVEVQYGGMFRVRLGSSDNVADGSDNIRDIGTGYNTVQDDNANYIDQRLRFYLTYVSSENLKVVTKYEEDTVWGLETAGRSGGGDVGADATNIEMKNAYVDFALPNTPARMMVGVQGITVMSGWIVDDDMSAAVALANFNPIKVRVGYVAAQNQAVNIYTENVDSFFTTIDYAQGPFKAGIVGWWQDAHNTNMGFDPGIVVPNVNNAWGNFNASNHAAWTPGFIEDNQLFDLGFNLEYKDPLWSAYLNFVKNFGGVDANLLLDGKSVDTDYNGWMVEASGSYYCGPLTLTVGGFATSGADVQNRAEDFGDYFRYPAGMSHYWSEIMSPGVLDVSVAGFDHQLTENGYASNAYPSNLWMINVGGSWQILDGTKATLNYYYVATMGDVVAGTHLNANNVLVNDYSNTIGNEIDFYLDQQIVDKLSIKLVAAYLVADDGYTAYNSDDNAYKLGAQLLWAF